MLPTIVVMVHFKGWNFRHFWKSLKARQSWAVHIIFWAVLLFSSQMLDKSRWHVNFVEIALEENMEFGAAIMVFMVLLKYPLNFDYGATEPQWVCELISYNCYLPKVLAPAEFL